MQVKTILTLPTYAVGGPVKRSQAHAAPKPLTEEEMVAHSKFPADAFFQVQPHRLEP